MASRFLDTEELALYVLIGAIGVIPVLIALWTGRVLEAEATIGLLMLAGAIAGVAAVVRASHRDRP